MIGLVAYSDSRDAVFRHVFPDYANGDTDAQVFVEDAWYWVALGTDSSRLPLLRIVAAAEAPPLTGTP